VSFNTCSGHFESFLGTILFEIDVSRLLTYSEETAIHRPNFLHPLSNSGRAVRRYSEGRTIHPKTLTGDYTPQYLVASYLPDDFDPSSVTEAVVEKIHGAQP
jgi:hypothetical protein